MVEELKVAIQEEWERFMKEDYRKCIESMHQQFKLVIWARRGFIKY